MKKTGCKKSRETVPLKGSVGGWGYLVDFAAKQIKEFCLKKANMGVTTQLFSAHLKFENQNQPIGSLLGQQKV